MCRDEGKVSQWFQEATTSRSWLAVLGRQLRSWYESRQGCGRDGEEGVNLNMYQAPLESCCWRLLASSSTSTTATKYSVLPSSTPFTVNSCCCCCVSELLALQRSAALLPRRRRMLRSTATCSGRPSSQSGLSNRSSDLWRPNCWMRLEYIWWNNRDNKDAGVVGG